MKSVMVNNVASSYKNYDTLMNDSRSLGTVACLQNKCGSARMGCLGFARKIISSANLSLEARDFFREYFQERKNLEAFEPRWKEVSESIDSKGFYEFTSDELAFGAQTAWRNVARCSGRSQWQSLELRDCRHVDNVNDMFVEICKQIKESTNGGAIVPKINVFPQRKPGCKDALRVWNGQLISYAGYANPDDPEIIIGDRGNVTFTQFCMSLGWQGKGGRFDVLPLVLSGSDGIPKFFEIPEELILRVKITHPKLTQIGEMGLEWYGLPAVSNMLLEIGGQQFPACPFSGWYAVTEIATRDFLDEHRYNLLHELANTLGYDTTSLSTLWKDSVCVDLSVAVLHSYQLAGVAIVDHHTLAKQFVDHFNHEYKVRGGCPGDWIWVTSPMSGSLTPTFHQEMLNYHLSPSYEYQEPLWKKYKTSNACRMSVKGLGKALWFACSLFMKRYQRRKKAVILYGSMTGTSKSFASSFKGCMDQLFQTTVMPLNDNSLDLMKNMSRSGSAVFIITSTTGNGQPPNHAIGFKSALEDALASKKACLKDLHFSVLALGSSNYENFCSFGSFCDSAMTLLGGQRLTSLQFADEQKGQDKALMEWSKLSLMGSCQMLQVELTKQAQANWPFAATYKKLTSWTPHTFKVTNKAKDIKNLHGSSLDNVNLLSTVLVAKKALSPRYTLFTLGFPHNPSIRFEPGDHLYIFPENDPEYVETIKQGLVEAPLEDDVVVWNDCDIPPSTLTNALTAFLDLGSPLTPDLMMNFSQFASSQAEKKQIQDLCNEISFKKWRSKKPNVVNFMSCFPSLSIPAGYFVASMRKMMPRPYSVASISPQFARVGRQTIPVTDLLIETCEFETGPFSKLEKNSKLRRGVTSNYLIGMQIGQTFLTYQQGNGYFKVPKDPMQPIVLISAGSGIAPFRPFWQQRAFYYMPNSTAWLYFGCRDKSEDLFAEETKSIVQRKVAFSRMDGQQKTYVQDLLEQDSAQVFDLMMNKNANFFICGKASMASDVAKRLADILMYRGHMSLREAQDTIHQMRRNGKLEEEYFG